MGTISFADVYGQKTPGGGDTVASAAQSASGKTAATSSTNPAMVLVAMAAIFVVIRFLWEKGG